jgi:predicted glutamine amidotransferase
MCRALLYLGQPVLLDNLLYQPDSALVRQSYMPKMLHMLNLAGFGLRAWDPASADPERAFSYYSQSLPVFDRNLQNLAQKVRPTCVLAHVRGVAYSTRVEISLQNVHPFHFPGVPLVLAHNGDLADFARMKPLLLAHIRPEFVAQIHGTTDSEWIYALLLSRISGSLHELTEDSVFAAIQDTLDIIREARARLGIALSSSVNLFIANGTQLAAVRYCFDFGCYRTEDRRLDHRRLRAAHPGHLGLGGAARVRRPVRGDPRRPAPRGDTPARLIRAGRAAAGRLRRRCPRRFHSGAAARHI